MVLIENCNGRNPKLPKGGPERTIGWLHPIYSQICSAIISKGNKITDEFSRELIKNSWKPLSKEKHFKVGLEKNGVKAFFNYKICMENETIEVDLFITQDNKIEFFELKDDAAHDTKKCKEEVNVLSQCKKYFENKGHKNISLIFCSFYSPTIKDVRVGTKNMIPENIINIFTGKMLCQKFDLNYEKVKKYRNLGVCKNIGYVVETVIELTKKHNPKLLQKILKKYGYEKIKK
jgi:hypothetical protein